MTYDPPRSGPAELRLVDEPATAVDKANSAADAPIAGGKVDNESRRPSADRFLFKATREYEQGHIDQPLWVRAVAQSRGDEAAAIAAYLRSRATALRVLGRERRAETPAARVKTAAANDAASGETGPARHDGAKPKPKLRQVAVIAAIVGLVVVIGIVVALKHTDSTRQAVAAATPPKPVASARGAAVATAAQQQQDSGLDFGRSVQRLKEAGNWNVVVLYAAEWTRKQPQNAAAWNELSIGYGNLRQFEDAYDAATKATQLAPEDPLLWRNLGQVNLLRNDAAAALTAFERAAALNDQDVRSLVEIGTINVALGKLPEARLAFDKAVALSPENADALCGQATVAQRAGRPKEADAIARELKSVGGKCRDANDGASVAAIATEPAARKPRASNVR